MALLLTNLLGALQIAPSAQHGQRPLTLNHPDYPTNPQKLADQQIDLSHEYPVDLWDPDTSFANVHQDSVHEEHECVRNLDEEPHFEKQQVLVHVRESGAFVEEPIELRMVTPTNAGKVEGFKTTGFEFDSLFEMKGEQLEEFHTKLRSLGTAPRNQQLHGLSPFLLSIANAFAQRNGLRRIVPIQTPFIVSRGGNEDPYTHVHFDEDTGMPSETVRLWIPISKSLTGRVNNLCLALGDMSGLDIHRYKSGRDMTRKGLKDIPFYEENDCGPVWFSGDTAHCSRQRKGVESKQRDALVSEWFFEK